MSNLDDTLVFADEDEAPPPEKSGESWHLLVVDDEPVVHQVTNLALKNFSFASRPLIIDSAFSAEEAKETLKNKDYAVILLDVVMETDHAGLDLVKWIREQHKNTHVRIVLRTGQPGQAPERSVVEEFDVNDYKEKTELTSNKLHTLMYACLRSYRDIVALYRNKLGLENIILGTDKIFSQHSLMDFTQGALEQLTVLLKADEGSFYGNIEGLAATRDDSESKIVAATGPYKEYISCNLEVALDKVPSEEINKALNGEGLVFGQGYVFGVYQSHLKRKNVLFMDGLPNLSEFDERLIQLFCNHLGVAFDNIALLDEVELTQRELIYRLSEAVESRSKETSNHVKRMAHICRILGKAVGLDDSEVDVLFTAAPLHDIGKIAIPDSILNKPGRLDEREWSVMKNHAVMGFEILSNSKLELLNAGAAIAIDHHERWDGSGYPNGKKGKEIHLFGRIAAIADVFDALYNRRCYKDPWPLSEVSEHLTKEKGAHFDPELIDKFFERMDDMIKIQQTYPD